MVGGTTTKPAQIKPWKQRRGVRHNSNSWWLGPR
jgi:hypothetical protein